MLCPLWVFSPRGIFLYFFLPVSTLVRLTNAY